MLCLTLTGIFIAVATQVPSCTGEPAAAVVAFPATKRSRAGAAQERSANHSSCRSFRLSRRTRTCRTSETRSGKRHRRAATCWLTTTSTRPSQTRPSHPPVTKLGVPVVNETRRRRSPVTGVIEVTVTASASQGLAALTLGTVSTALGTSTMETAV